MQGESAQSLTDECFRCGYNLLGIANDQPCPECGLLAERSRYVSDTLHDTRPRWLRAISWGTNLILLAVLISAAWPILFLVIEDYIRHSQTAWWNVQVDSLLGIEFSSLIFLWGALLLTRPEGYPPADRMDRKLRKSIRIAAMVLVLAAILHAINAQLEMNFLISQQPQWQLLRYDDEPFPLAFLYAIATLLAAIAAIPLPCMIFFRLRGLARRARSAHLAEHCAIVGIGATASILYAIPIVAVFTGWIHVPQRWLERSTAAIVIPLILLLAAGLFLLWSLYLYIRFAIAFHKAAKLLRQKWRRDDRSQSAES